MPFKATRINHEYVWLTHTHPGQDDFYGTTIVIRISDWSSVKEMVDRAISEQPETEKSQTSTAL